VLPLNSNIIETLTRNFKHRNIEVSAFNTLQEAKAELLKLISVDKTVGVGHSATLQAMDIVDALLSRGNVVFDKTKASSKTEVTELKRKALLADWYITGSNAVSAEGHIVNIDHSGNRVAAMTYGPDKVVIVVGVNKLTPNLEEAIHRAKNEASPKNARRAGFNPPCVELGHCIDCSSPEKVCNYVSIIQGQHQKDRMKLFIVGENLGF
jgi:L-lactate utilization protein LutC